MEFSAWVILWCYADKSFAQPLVASTAGKFKPGKKRFALREKQSLLLFPLALSVSALLGALLSCAAAQAQIKEPSIPNPAPFQSVIINEHNRTATAIPNATVRNIHQQVRDYQARHRQQMDLIRDEVNKHNRSLKSAPQPFDPQVYRNRLDSFEHAYRQLMALLNDQAQASVSDAFYIMENAYGNNYLSQQAYDSIIDRSARFIKTWMRQNGYDVGDNDATHEAIQKFMSEKLSVSQAVKEKDGKTTFKTITHLPFLYSYADNGGEQDHRNLFLTKCLATGSGQCSSLPKVYLVLAEKLGAKAYLTFTPEHSFIKYRRNNGEIENYEPTSNWHINNQWYQESMFISPEAIASGIYLDTFNRQQIIADCLVGLGLAYTRKMPIDDGAFIAKCIRSSIPFFPKGNHIAARFLHSTLLKGLLQRYLSEKHITSVDQIAQYPEALALQQSYLHNEETIRKLGYQDLPEGLYNELLKEEIFKRKAQESRNITGREERELFIETTQ